MPVLSDSFALTLLLVRHGETAYNAEGRYQGHHDIRLSLVGQKQARQLGRRLRHDWAQKTVPGPPGVVYSSDLSRAVETATIVLHEAGISARAVYESALLRERGYGVWEGLTRAQIAGTFPGMAEPEAAETWRTVYERTGVILREIWQNNAEPVSENNASPTVLVCGHGGALRAFLCHAAGLGHDSLQRFTLGNTSLSVVRFVGTREAIQSGRLLLVNDTSHLNTEVSCC